MHCKNTIFVKENECTRDKNEKISACGALYKGKYALIDYDLFSPEGRKKFRVFFPPPEGRKIFGGGFQKKA